mmetsp:Transcript_23805/g.49600  ORF Transcript_23805/g.49600 Transcript_23805/m.49600 type:complete len:418 (+) Transcript_23805:148-1401(+)
MIPMPEQKLSSTTNAATVFFKSLFGAGVLAVPHAMSSVGLPLALLLYSIICAICCGTVYLLLEAKRFAVELGAPKEMTFQDLAKFLIGPRSGAVVAGVICSCELCFCSGFIIVTLDNFNQAEPGVSREVAVLVLTPILILLGQIKWLPELCIFSFLGALIYGVGVIGCSIVYGIQNWSPPPDLFEFKWENISSFLGTATYALEGICLVLPVERSMARKEQAIPMSVSSLILYGIVTLSYSAVAYSAGLGRDDCSIVTDCFDDGSAVYTLRIALCAALILSHPVTLFPASEILENLLSSSFFNVKGSKNSELTSLLMLEEGESQPRKFQWGRALRVCNVCLTLAIGFLFKDFSIFSNVIGGIGLTLIGFVFPPILYVQGIQQLPITPPIPLKIKTLIVFCAILATFNIVMVGLSIIYK